MKLNCVRTIKERQRSRTLPSDIRMPMPIGKMLLLLIQEGSQKNAG